VHLPRPEHLEAWPPAPEYFVTNSNTSRE
jgi:hypothetical protein